MKKKIGVFGVLLCLFQVSYGQGNVQKFQEMYQRIGNDLLKIKKQYTQAQPVIYALLDQVGEFYSLAKKTAENETAYKQRFQAEQRANNELKKELDSFRDKFGSVKNAMSAVDKKLQKDAKMIQKLSSERDALAREKEKLEQEKHAFEREKQGLLAQRDALMREKDATAREREVLSHEKEALGKK